MAIKRRPIDVAELKKLAEKIPCSSRVVSLAENEIANGNILLALDRVSFHPSETYYICQFKYLSKTNPSGLKIHKRKFDGFDDYYQYEVLTYGNNSGTVEIRFFCDWEVC